MSDEQNLGDFSMLELFRVEVEGQLEVLTNGLVSLEAEAGVAREQIEPLMRAAHSVKGAARIVGLDAAVGVAHVMEDCFVAAQEKRIELEGAGVDALLEGCDFLRSISLVAEADLPEWLSEQGAAIAALEKKLAAVREGTWQEEKKAEPAAAAGAETQAFSSLVETKAEEVPLPSEIKTEGNTEKSALTAMATISPDASTAAKSSPAKPREEEKGGEAKNRAVRVTAENLNRLMGLAAESLVEARQLEPLSDDLVRLKQNYARLAATIGHLRERSQRGGAVDDETDELWFEAQRVLGDCRHEIAERIDDFESFARRSGNLADRLYREVVASRMRPFEDGTAGFPRLIRDLARQLDKKVRLEIAGKGTPVDRDVLERLEAPLTHLLRNALDHAIELPEVRAAAGKAAEGKIKLEAHHRAGMLLITVQDDGRGIDLGRLRGKIVEKGLTSAAMAGNLSEAEVLDFLFLPGFSTAEKVTEISGRGVGLDVVQSMVHDAGGSVRIQTQQGSGTMFALQLPITRSVLRALLVNIAGEPYAMPLARIERAVRLHPADLKSLENRLYFTLDGVNVGLVSAKEVLGLDHAQADSEEICVVVIGDRNSRYGVEVDTFLGERDLVVRPLDARLGLVPDVSSASLMEDGAPLLILDVDDMARSIDSLLTGGNLSRRRQRTAAAAGQKRTKRVLVVDDSITVREVERKLLESRGYEVDVAVDGMEGWNAVRLGQYDLVLSDVDMPRMNGIEFVRLIKQDPRLKSLPVMIVSYKDREEDRLRGLEAGADYYLTKSSFHDATLLQSVVDLIGEAGTS